MLKRKHTEDRKLTNKQQRFVDTYAGNIKKTAKKAGLSYGYCRRLVTKSNIFEAIRHRQDIEIRPKTIANRQQRQEFWTKVMRDENEDIRDRLRASELLGKSETDFVEHLVLDSEDALTDEECDEIREMLKRSFEK
jgi:phage terminase small subunit